MTTPHLLVHMVAIGVILLPGSSSVAQPTGRGCSVGDSDGTSAKVTASGNITRGTQDIDVYKGDIETTTRGPAAEWPWRLRLVAQTHYETRAKSGSTTTYLRVHRFSAQQLVCLGAWQLAAAARALHSNPLGIKAQHVFDLGFGRDLEFGVATLSLRVGPGFIARRWILGDSSSSSGAVFAAPRASFAIGGTELAVAGELAQPFDGDVASYSYLSGIYVVPLMKRVALNVSATRHYVSAVPAGYKRSFFNTSIGVSVTLAP